MFFIFVSLDTKKNFLFPHEIWRKSVDFEVKESF